MSTQPTTQITITKPAYEYKTGKKVPEAGPGFWGADGFTFGDLVDLVNPLQHIPIVSSIYRAVTGDEIAAGPRLVGGAVLGGPVGFLVAAIDTVSEAITGQDTGEHVVAVLTGKESVKSSQLASIESEAVTEAEYAAAEAEWVDEPLLTADAHSLSPALPASEHISSPAPQLPPAQTLAALQRPVISPLPFDTITEAAAGQKPDIVAPAPARKFVGAKHVPSAPGTLPGSFDADWAALEKQARELDKEFSE